MCFPFNIYNAYKTSVNPISEGLQHCSNCTESRSLPVALFLSSTYALLPDLCCMQKLKRIWAVEVLPNANTCSLGSHWHLSPTMLAASDKKWFKGEEEYLQPRHTSSGVQARGERTKPSHMGIISTRKLWCKKTPHLLFFFKKSVCWIGTTTLPISWQLSEIAATSSSQGISTVGAMLVWSHRQGRFTGFHL